MGCALSEAARLLVDVDAMCKLAHWQALELLPQVTGLPLARCETLPSCRFRALKAAEKPDGRLFRSADAALAVVRVVDLFAEMPQPSSVHLATFEDVPGVDAGEAVLLAHLLGDANAVLLTGDKRALRALAALPPSVRAPLARRILSVECFVKCVLDLVGIDELRARVCQWKDVDKAIAIVMGSRCDQGEASVREGLQSYLGELASLCVPPLMRDC